MLFAALFILVVQQSCNDSKVTNDSPKILWQTSLSDGELIRAFNLADIQFNGGILLGGMSQGRCLYFVDIEEGKILWKWNDYMPTDLGWSLRSPYINDSKVFILDGRHQYCINLGNGKTIWKRMNISDFGTQATGLTNMYIIPARYYPNGDGTTESKVLSGNLIDGTGEEVLVIPEYTRAYTDPNLQKGTIRSIPQATCF